MRTDDSLREELSLAFHAGADPVTRLATAPEALLSQAARYRRRRVAIRVGGLTAAVAVAAAATLIAGGVSPAPARAPTAASPATNGPGRSAPAGALLAAKVASAPSASAAASGMPSFYAITDPGAPDLEIRATATGNLLSTVELPADTDAKASLVAASGDDRTFVLSAFSLSGGTSFYETKVTASGQASELVKLPITSLSSERWVNDIAVSPDGTRLALVTQEHGARWTIEVADLATGTVRTWTSQAASFLSDLTWDNAGRRLSYFNAGTDLRTAGLWRLDTEAPGHALLSGPRLLPLADGPDTVQEALLTPDGQHIIASVTLNSLSHVTDSTIIGGIVQVDAQTGRPLQNLLAQRATSVGSAGATVTSCQLQSVDPAGDHLLVNCAGHFGRLDHARFTTLTGAGDLSPTASAW
jgi:hypothetical protein